MPEKTTTADFLLHMIPETLFSSLTSGVVLQTLLVALLVGFGLQAMGKAGKPILVGIGHIQRLVFRVLSMIMWAAPIGAFGAIAAVVGETGLDCAQGARGDHDRLLPHLRGLRLRHPRPDPQAGHRAQHLQGAEATSAASSC